MCISKYEMQVKLDKREYIYIYIYILKLCILNVYLIILKDM